MNRDAPSHEPPELSDEDIKLLHQICKRATRASDPPFKALFNAYDRVFAEEQIEQAHDGVVFRLLMRIGEAARGSSTQGESADYVRVLRELLEAQGITVLDEDDEDYDDTTHSFRRPPVRAERPRPQDRRRVSFDDAHLEQIWLDEQEPTTEYGDLSRSPLGLLSERPRRSIERVAAHGGRSSSADAVPWQDHASTSALVEAGSFHSLTAEMSEDRLPGGYGWPTLEELEENADAFFETSQLRNTRALLHRWHDLTVAVRTFNASSAAIATAHDHCTLLRQAYDIWHEKAITLRQQRLEEERVDDEVRQALLRKYFEFWLRSAEAQRSAVSAAKTILLKVRYFKRWRALAIENAAKVRRVIALRVWRRWRAITLKRLDQAKEAEVHLKQTLIKRCYSAWFWHFCHRRVEGWHEDRVLESIFARLRDVGSSCSSRNQQANGQHEVIVQRKALRLLRECAVSSADDANKAEDFYQSSLKRQCLRRWTTLTKLKRPLVTLNALISSNAKRNVLRILVDRHRSSLQAREFDHRRLLRASCTAWNDALRHRVLTSQINERIVVENLYRWVLQERLALFKRTQSENIKRLHLDHWHQRTKQQQSSLEDAVSAFQQRQERRYKAFGMLQLHYAVRRREDACRSAIEFDNDHILPRVIRPWIAKARALKTHEKWATDASYYFTTTVALNTWKARTHDHQQRRKRDAYVQIRTRVKTRTARFCFGRLRDKSRAIRMLAEESDARIQAKTAAECDRTFGVLREIQLQRNSRQQHATQFEQNRLRVAGLAALAIKHERLLSLQGQAEEFRHESDMDVAAGLIKMLQWYQFTAARRLETADALAARNRDAHVRHMLRHWAARTRGQRESKVQAIEPESPSLRPASRAASRRTQQNEGGDLSLAPMGSVTGTPAYLRTPSRPRRAARFRPIPTPAPNTPFVFDPSYLVTVPGALTVNEPGQSASPSRHGLAETEGEGESSFAALAPQVTPFARKLMARGIVTTPAPALRSSVFGRVAPGTGGTTKSVRFARHRFTGVGSSSSTT